MTKNFPITHLNGAAPFERQFEAIAEGSFAAHSTSTAAIVVSLDNAMERIVELEINLGKPVS